MFEEGRMIFEQIAEIIEDQIIQGAIGEDEQAPSTNELAHFYRINPATAAKGLNLLVERGILVKRRGIGMFVDVGARARLLHDRRERFKAAHIDPLVHEASKLALTERDVNQLISAAYRAANSAKKG